MAKVGDVESSPPDIRGYRRACRECRFERFTIEYNGLIGRVFSLEGLFSRYRASMESPLLEGPFGSCHQVRGGHDMGSVAQSMARRVAS